MVDWLFYYEICIRAKQEDVRIGWFFRFQAYNSPQGRYRGPVHTKPEEFENGALFPLLGLPFTQIRRENGTFRKRSWNRRNLKTAVFRFRVNWQHFKNGAFQQRWRRDGHVISLTVFSSNTNPKWRLIFAFLDSSGLVWTKNVWCVFRVKPPFSNSSGVVVTVPETRERFWLNRAGSCWLRSKIGSSVGNEGKIQFSTYQVWFKLKRKNCHCRREILRSAKLFWKHCQGTNLDVLLLTWSW